MPRRSQARATYTLMYSGYVDRQPQPVRLASSSVVHIRDVKKLRVWSKPRKG